MNAESATSLLDKVVHGQLVEVVEDASSNVDQTANRATSTWLIPSGKAAILAIVERAATDTYFMAELLDDPDQALRGYNLTLEERTMITGGDLHSIKKHTGELKTEHRKWLWRRLRQERL